MKSRFSFSQTFDHHRETPSTYCTYSIAEPVINENWSLLTPLQQRLLLMPSTFFLQNDDSIDVFFH